MRYPDDFVNKIIQGDCLEVMQDIPDNSIDCVFADLPFYQEWQEEINNEIYSGLTKQDKKIINYLIWNEKLIKEIDRILKNGGNIILVNSPRYILSTIHLWLDKFIFRNQIPLIRKGSLRPAWMLGFQHNIMIFLVKGDKKLKWNGARKNHDKSFPTDVWLDIPYQNGYRGKGVGNWHPEAINLPIVERAIYLNSMEGDIVLDITAGSGTTGVACKKLNRNYILIEKEPKYVKMAEERINAIQKSLIS
jgi:site-specific DNA-methyltransferase (adenine-specific)